MDGAARTKAIKEEARRLGFDKVGIAPAGDADPEGRLARWIALGRHAGMDYMARNAATRADPRALVEGARSVIALAMSYYTPDPEAPVRAKIARYARGRDYHTILRKKIRKLRKFILELDPTARVHPGVDTSPVLERAWAERAGIAWIGKSTMAIAQDLGTYTFLATLITTLELESDEPHVDRCGSCTACLDACPTGAFAGPYELDAKKCITYWNVEHRAPFTPETPPLSGWLAGCDVCQEVCPWNKFAQPTREAGFAPRPELAEPDLLAFAAEDRAEWRARVLAGTALQRTGEAALQRSALAILNSPRPSEPDPKT